jgi:hypothetical protein
MSCEHEGLDDDDLQVLVLRYSEQPESPEWRLVSAFLRLHMCWRCLAELHVDQHPRCQDCPEWDESAEPEGSAAPEARH